MFNCTFDCEGVKFEVKRVWIDCLLDNKTKWKDRAAKGEKFTHHDCLRPNPAGCLLVVKNTYCLMNRTWNKNVWPWANGGLAGGSSENVTVTRNQLKKNRFESSGNDCYMYFFLKEFHTGQMKKIRRADSVQRLQVLSIM